MNPTIIKNLSSKGLDDCAAEISSWVNEGGKLRSSTWNTLFGFYRSRMDYATASGRNGDAEGWVKEQLQFEWHHEIDPSSRILSQKEIDDIILSDWQVDFERSVSPFSEKEAKEIIFNTDYESQNELLECSNNSCGCK